MSDVEKLLASYEMWCLEREDLSRRDVDPHMMPSSSEWHDSDDAAVDLMHRLAQELHQRTQSYLTVEEVAERMRVSRMTVYRLCNSGELSAVRIGRSFRISIPGFRDYLQKNETTGRV